MRQHSLGKQVSSQMMKMSHDVAKSSIYDVRRAQVTITCPQSGRKEIIQGPKFQSPDFRKLFVGVPAKMVALRDEVGPSGRVVEPLEGTFRYPKHEKTSIHETSESEGTDSEEPTEDEDDSDLEDKRKQNRKNNMVQVRGVTLEIPQLGDKVDKVKYLEPHCYLKLYEKDASYSHMAHRVLEMPSELGLKRMKEAIMIIDHEDRWERDNG